MPEGMNKKSVSIENRQDGVPNPEEPFTENSSNKWSEFYSLAQPPSGFAITGVIKNKEQAKVRMDQPEQVFHYLPELSTEAKSKFTDDPKSRVPTAKADFMDRVKPAPAARPIAASYGNPYNTMAATARSAASDRPYVYKPKVPTPTPVNSGYNIDPRALASQRQFSQDAGRRASYSNMSPYGAPPALQTQVSDPNRQSTAPLRPFPGDAYYSSRVLPAAMPGEYSTFSEQVRRNSGAERRPSLGMLSYQGQPFSGSRPQTQNGASAPHNSTGPGLPPITHAHPPQSPDSVRTNTLPRMESLLRRASRDEPMNGMYLYGEQMVKHDSLSLPGARNTEHITHIKEEPPITKTLPQLPAPATSGLSDSIRRSSMDWTPPSHQYHSYDRAPFPPYQTPPQYSVRPQPTYQSASDFQQQIALQSQRPSVANRYGAYDRMIRDMASTQTNPNHTFSSGGYTTPHHSTNNSNPNAYAAQSPKAPTPSPLSDTQTPSAARAQSPAPGSWGVPLAHLQNRGERVPPIASMMQGGAFTLPMPQSQAQVQSQRPVLPPPPTQTQGIGDGGRWF